MLLSCSKKALRPLVVAIVATDVATLGEGSAVEWQGRQVG